VKCQAHINKWARQTHDGSGLSSVNSGRLSASWRPPGRTRQRDVRNMFAGRNRGAVPYDSVGDGTNCASC
jgi:hypothetical protein